MTKSLLDPRELPDKRNKRTTVCAKTIVASRMPSTNRMWKVAVTSLDVASTISDKKLAKLNTVIDTQIDIQVATMADSNNAASTQSTHCEDPA